MYVTLNASVMCVRSLFVYAFIQYLSHLTRRNSNNNEKSQFEILILNDDTKRV